MSNLFPESLSFMECEPIRDATMACSPQDLFAQQAMANIEQSFETTEEQKKRQQQAIHQWTVFVIAFCCASVVLAILSMIRFYSSWLIWITFFFPLLIGPYVIYQRRRINRLPTVRQELNLIRFCTNRLRIQNIRLYTEISRLQPQVQRLKQAEERLQAVARVHGIQSSELEVLVKENGRTVREMKELQQAQQLQQILASFLASDVNNDRVLSPDELDALSQRLQIFSHSRVPIDDALLREAFRLQGASAVSTTTLFKRTQELIRKNEKEEAKEDEAYTFPARNDGTDEVWEELGYRALS